ncbi:MAG: threonylcarbamoyl-AMP synthase [Clostridia bacterium]|nr:threonylcarbamoyl-AMP synthase [Clostridia bacterium]
MKTLYLTPSPDDIKKAAEIIKRGGLVAFPTETVYGLGGSAGDAASAQKIYAAKGRPSDNPLIIHVSKAGDAEKYAVTNELFRKLAAAFCPGPLTMILPKKDTVPYAVTGGLDTVAVRIPSHPVARAFIDACGVAIAAPSANVSGSPSPTTAEHVKADLDGKIDAVIDGGACEIGLESTIIKFTDGKAVILRPGAVTEEMLSSVVPVGRDRSMFEKPADDIHPEAPGMKYRHYAPKVPVTLLKGPRGSVVGFMKERLAEDGSCGVICPESEKKTLHGRNVSYLPDDPAAQANGLFDLLRSYDKSDAKHIYSVTPPRTGIGFALYNRLMKASGFDTLRVGITIPVIGLTGQSGAGKSTVAAIFGQKGAFVADCDAVYRQLLYKNSPLVKKIKKSFPEAVKKGLIDRPALAEAVFSDKEKLALLDRITHADILDEVRNRLFRAQEDGYKFAVVDASQLFEAGYDAECTAVVGVCADEELRIKRITERDGISRDKALMRLSRQHNEDFFRVYCDVTVDNDAGEDALLTAVDGIIKKYVPDGA